MGEAQETDRRLPELRDFRLRRLRARLPLEVLAVKAGIPGATLSRFERGLYSLDDERLRRLESALHEAEARP